MTVGTQIPFDRLGLMVESWHSRNSHVELVAQVGKGGRRIPSAHCAETYQKDELDALMRQAEVVVSHAGMGSIISAQTFNVPIVVVPRRHDLGEHRNDHQMATAKAMAGRSGVYVAWDEDSLFRQLDCRQDLISSGAVNRNESEALIRALSSLIGN